MRDYDNEDLTLIARNRVQNQRRDTLRFYGITPQGYDEMMRRQKGVCALCNRSPQDQGRRLSVDHNHETGEIRGLLCGNCNRGIGLLQDNPTVLRKATAYLEPQVLFLT